MILKGLKIVRDTILVLLAVFIVMAVIQAFWAFIGLVITKNPASAEHLFLERMYPLTAAYILIFWARKYRNMLYFRILEALDINKNNIFAFIKTVILFLSILYILFIISGLLNHFEFIYFGTEEYSFLTILKQILLVGIIGNILAAIGEEIIFRSFLMDYIISISKSKLFGLLFVSFIFSLHPYVDLSNYVIAFIAGLIMGYAYLKFKTLYIPIGIHFAYNLFNFTIASAPGRGPQLPYLVKFDYLRIADGLGVWTELFIILGFLIILIFLWYKKAPVGKVDVSKADLDL